MTWLLATAAVLVLWAGIAAVRRRSEYTYRTPQRTDARTPGNSDTADHDGIDRAALEEAEREVKDLDAFHKPDDGFQGDDWGPGASRR